MTTQLIRNWLIVSVISFAGCNAPPGMATTVDVEQMRQMLDAPAWTDAQWQQWCKDSAPGEAGHCTIEVQIDCPPDCGIYRLVREDRLARRRW